MSAQIVCVGETMLLLTAADPTPLDRAPLLTMGVAGAESNVASGLAALGHRAAWISAVGDDPFGRLITRTLREGGVDVTGVRVDQDRPTGVFAKDPSPEGSTVHYYRTGSAASALGPELVGDPRVRAAGRVHLSGVTPALSPACDALAQGLMEAPGLTVSFDVNHRPRLWGRDEAAPRLLALARLADTVFVGRDEAEELWGTSTDHDVRALLPDVERLVVKDAENGASEFHGDTRVYVPAPTVEVVEPVGAGDAFAAGYLAGDLRGLDGRGRLRLGHLCAGRVLRVTGDLADPPQPHLVDALVAVADEHWPVQASAAVAAVRGDNSE